MRAIRLAGEQEFNTVREFYWEVIDKMQSSPFLPGWKKGIYPADDFLQHSLQCGELYVLVQDNQIVAAMVLNHQCNDGYQDVPWKVDAEENEITVIHALGVLPDVQGQGVAGELVQAAICEAKKAGQKTIRLDVLKGNEPACQLYEGCGFQYRKTVRMFYEDTGWTEYLLYELPL